MPSTYAHYRLGKEVRKMLNKDAIDVIVKYPELYFIGLHGPDILFYYKPLKKTYINQVGYNSHEMTGEDFFTKSANIIKKHSENKAYLAYIYGFICHYVLDSMCHGYIDEKINKSGISHTEIEVEFDRKLMIMDGLDPIRHKLTNHIVISDVNAQVIKEFFPGITKDNIVKSLKGMISYNNLLIAPSKLKRTFIKSLLSISGNYEDMHGLVVNYEKNPKCQDSNWKLLYLYDKSIKKAVELIEKYNAFLVGESELDECYKYTFGSQLKKREEIAG